MSLIKQLWIGIAIVMSIAFGASFVVSTLSARHYLEQQLYVKNLDNASSLALSLSQMPKDAVTVELQIAAQFDAGHYRLIRLVAPSGELIVEREYADERFGAPGWFARLVPIRAQPGIAQVQDGWRQFGTLTLESHSRYAYESLWQGTLQLLAWFVAGAVLTGLVGTMLIKHITRPLGRVVDQAEAIGERRFITIDEPSTTEFRSVVRAMNALSERVRTMLAGESRRLEALRRQAHHDELTGLVNRSQFLNLVDAALSREDAAAGGSLMMVRLGDLGQLNRQFGHQETDRLLRELAACVQAVADAHPGWEAGRLNASDFALLAPGQGDPDAVVHPLAEQLHALRERWRDTASLRLPIGAAAYYPNERHGNLLARTDATLAAAELTDDDAASIAPPSIGAPLHSNLDDWRQTILGALEEHGVRLALYPVVATGAPEGRLLHHEAPMRLFIDGNWQNAGYFMPQAARLGLLGRLDGAVLAGALGRIARDGTPLGINLSAEALCDPAFRSLLLDELQAQPNAARKLWIEFTEHDIVRHQSEFNSLCAALKPLGCKLGIEHVGRRFSQISGLHALGIDYLKINRALVRGIEADIGNQSFLRGLCTVAHAIGLIVIAEGVSTEDEREALSGLGVDGVTGPLLGNDRMAPPE
ncbi:EAL domain-containing protein [Thauera aromatica]|nr:EAL domain-containing protein [Thauera aromatica]MCK2127885.1 EAL domain-containing protein [Thauera aromatica]